ncbi:hypothetical protein [Cytobacillus purgationiresistens]|uniref:Uncharacterized protein n=1 Tax=Cytobacillus purgationiresistens TaxID=863449 RepID=A0ABU0ALH9_9BACI|nr:hypothetical protein [Cytobacillus purgationiresistens]MDQ0272126.1 hypothetical protein [Cytobacillus purgationiresistens]
MARKKSQKFMEQKKDSVKGMIPISINIPEIGVEANVIEVGTLENGEMGVPEDN